MHPDLGDQNYDESRKIKVPKLVVSKPFFKVRAVPPNCWEFISTTKRTRSVNTTQKYMLKIFFTEVFAGWPAQESLSITRSTYPSPISATTSATLDFAPKYQPRKLIPVRTYFLPQTFDYIIGNSLELLNKLAA